MQVELETLSLFEDLDNTTDILVILYLLGDILNRLDVTILDDPVEFVQVCSHHYV